MSTNRTPRQRARIRPIVFVLFPVVLIAVFIMFWIMRPKSVRVATVTRTKLRASLTATGFVESMQARVAPKITGRIVRIFVDENTRVKAGQVLAELDSESMEAEAQASRQAVVGASEQARGAAYAVEAMKLQAPGAIGQAQASVDAARAQLKKLEGGSRPEEIAAAVAAADQARASVEMAGSHLKRATTALEQQRAVSEAAVNEAKFLLASARANEARIRAGARTQEIAKAEAALRDARARRDLAEKEVARAERLFAGGAISRQQVDTAQTTLTSAREVETSAKEQLDLLRAGAREEEREAARAEVAAAEARLERARAGEREIQLRQDEVAAARAQLGQAEAALRAATEQAKLIKAGSRREDVDTAGAKVREAVSALNQATSWLSQVHVRESERRAAQANAKQAVARAKAAAAQAKETKLVALFDGVVVRRYVDPGETVHPNTPVFLLADIRRRWVTAEIDAEDLAKVHRGQNVNVTAAAYPGRTFHGRVREISEVAEPKPGGRTRARIVRARVDFLKPAPELKPGLEVDVHTDTTLRPGAIIVPNDAVFMENGAHYALAVDGDAEKPFGQVKRRRIQVGAHTELETEILSGLREGERVVVEGKEDLQDGMRVRITQRTQVR